MGEDLTPPGSISTQQPSRRKPLGETRTTPETIKSPRPGSKVWLDFKIGQFNILTQFLQIKTILFLKNIFESRIWSFKHIGILVEFCVFEENL